MAALQVLPCARFRATLPAALIALAAVTGCSLGFSRTASPPASPPGASPVAGTAPSPTTPPFGSLVVVGRIVTMDEPPIVEALFIEDGAVVVVGSRGEVLVAVGDHVPVIDIGQNVAYPGFVDAHAHWIGIREYYRIELPAEARTRPQAAAGPRSPSSGSTPSASRNSPALAEDDNAPPLRVDAYLALNFDREFFGDWYTVREPGPVEDHDFRVEGLKIHLDDGWGHYYQLGAGSSSPPRSAGANEAGWQVSVHAMSSAANGARPRHAYEAALGPTGPNPLHHRIEHAIAGDGRTGGAPRRPWTIAIVTQFEGANRLAASNDRVGGRVRPRQPGA